MSETTTYQVYGKHRELFSARDSEVLLVGSAGTGKSFAAILKVHLFCMLNPGVRVVMLRKTLASLTNTGVVTYKSQIAKDVLANGDVVWYGGSPAESPSFKYSNGSVIILGGLDNPMKVMSAEYDLVYIQEATEVTEEDLEMVTTRLRNNKASFQQVLMDCNPQHPSHWLKRRCDAGKTKMITTRHEDNPFLYNQETGEITKEGASYMAKLDNLSGVRYLRLRKGIWAAAEGMVYEEFDPSVHEIDPFEIPYEWPRFWSIDFGYRNPFVCQHWAEDPDGRLYLYREFYWTGRIVEDHAKFILQRMLDERDRWKEPQPRVIVADHDAEGRATWERHFGRRTTLAKKDLVEGLQAAQARFKVQGDGKPRIFFFRDAVVERDPLLKEEGKPQSTLEEVSSYVWEQNKITVTGKPEKENPVKENDHGMDAMRYMIMERERSSQPRLRYMR